MVGEETSVELGTTIAGEGNRRPGITREYSGWDVYNNEAKKVDTKLVNDWRDSLNSLLLFAIFAAVLTAFIIESKKLLELNSADVMLDVMTLLTNNLANGTHSPYTRSQFEPAQSAINVNFLFFASLSTSLVVALASVVALQWVADYDAAITRGGSSPEDRAKRRQFRYSGVVWRKMSEIIAALPILLYCSVILFFGGLILWMWEVSHTVGFVVAGGAAIAILFYGITAFLSVTFASAPFRTPLGRLIYYFGHRIFSILYFLVHTLHKPSIPAWLERRYQADKVSRKREDNEVEHKTVQRSPLSLFALLVHLSDSLVKRGFDYPEDITLFAICVDKALHLPGDQRFAQTTTSLVGNTCRLANAMCIREHGTSEETQLASSEVMGTIYRLNTRLATMLISGRSKGRALAYVRTYGPFSPTVGWLEPCMD